MFISHMCVIFKMSDYTDYFTDIFAVAEGGVSDYGSVWICVLL